MRPVQVVLVPVDSGVVGARMGAGPDALMAAGLRSRLSVLDEQAAVVRLLPTDSWRAELRTTFQLHHRIADSVRGVVTAGRAPLVVAGDCNATVGVVAGLDGPLRTGVVWLDAHGDFNTPETDRSGYLDGQGLAMLTGRCWREHTGSLPGFEAVPDHRVLLAGARDLDEAEQEALAGSGVLRLSAAELADPSRTGSALDDLCRDVDRLHVHIDADVLDSGLGRANDWASPHGVDAEQVCAVVREAAARRPIASGTIASWDPSADPSGGVERALLSIADALAGCLASSQRSRAPGAPGSMT